jgi:hypothetical protein
MLTTAANIGFPMIGKWTAAKILFVVYKYGGAREEFTYCPKFLDEISYIQKMYGISGTEIPDAEIVAYIQQLEAENTDEIPQWANDLCKERYGFSLTNVSSNEINK